ncbi:transmembrane protein 161B [Schistocerca nitens]|uniref:transmembrane protein 161B n=1 Tax=Schistocerca nitens TaxID=7011 RepID=UPI0021175A76|nr:transmembrane protein 161B [Schistocerca nitens]
MALFGTQLVITLVMVSVIQKLGPHYSLARWLLCSTGLIRFLYPTDDELRRAAGVPKDKPKSKKGGRHVENGRAGDTFHVPRNLDIQLETAKVSSLDVVHLRYYSEYQWFVDFSLYAAIVYILTEVYSYYFPLKDEFNLSMVWCTLAVGFSLKLLLSLTAHYFRGEESVGERSTVLVTALIYLLVAMAVLIADERTLETGLDRAYASFNRSASQFLQDQQGLKSRGPASQLILKLSLAVWCGVVGALFTFPGLRMARMHWDSLRYSAENRVLRLLLNTSFALPLLLVVLWIRPVSRDYLTGRVFTGMTGPFMTPELFETMRLWLVVFAILLRIVLMPTYLQAYLNMAYHRLEEQKKEAGRITNTELQKKIAAVFYYMCVVTIQYVAPIIMCLFLTMMYKTLGGYTWTGQVAPATGFSPLDNPKPSSPLQGPSVSGTEGTESIRQSAQEFALALNSLKQVFTTEVFRGLLGFMTWWTCFSWFSTSSLGMLYQSYFRST